MKRSILLISSIGAVGCCGSQQTADNESPLVAKLYNEIYGPAPSRVNLNAERPNFLFITSDQHSWMTMGYNDPNISTPNLDRLAEMGVIFDRAYTCNPVSTPTRASMITGLYPSQHGAYALGTKLSEDVPTIGDYLGEAGYTTAIVGKAHFMPLAGNAEFPTLEGYPILQNLDFWREYNGPFYGFEYASLARNHGDESHVGQHYAIWMENKLRSEGKDPSAWKDWFVKPGGLEYAKLTEKMQSIIDENGSLHEGRQEGIWNIPEEYHLNAYIADVTNKKLDECAKSDKPFFIWASFFDPHPPYLVPEPWASMYDPDQMELPEVAADDLDDMPYHYKMTQSGTNDWAKAYVEDGQVVHGLAAHNTADSIHRRNKALYYGMVSMMDKYIGTILDKLEQSGKLDNTMIIFTTDHGHHIATHNLDKKGGFAFEEDLRIPFIAAWKGQYPAGKRTDALVSIVDLAPTFITLAGYSAVDQLMAGVDAHPLFKGEVDEIRSWVIAENHFQRTKFYQKSYIEDRYKITWYMNTNEGELFDLKEDPHEFHNLWDKAEYASLKSEMLLKAMQADMSTDVCWMPRLGPA